MWSPAISDFCGLQPWEMEDLTPAEADGVVSHVEMRIKHPVF